MVTKKSNEPRSVAQVAPGDRTVILVVTDKDAEDNTAAGLAGLALLGAAVGGPVGAAVGAGLGVLGAFNRKADIIKVAHSDAATNLVFQPGHPRLREAYARHPLVDTAYIPVGAFHRYLRESKHAELTRLLVALGATRVRVTLAHEGSTDAQGEVSVGLPGFVLQGKGTKKKDTRHKVLFDERYRPKGPPHIPEGLLWLPHEQSWQGLAERRLTHGTTEADVQLEYRDDYGVSAELAAKVEDVGGAISGGFVAMDRTVWDVHATFEDSAIDAEPAKPRKGWWPW